MSKSRILSVLGICLLATTLFAQPPRGERGNRGGDGSERGGRGFGGRGGPPGGSRGSFDPSSFLTRLDRNGNGMIDVDEQEGPARFMIQRMQQSDPSITPGKPISLKKITEGFNRMRGERGDRGDRGRGRDNFSEAADEALMAELLVPGFGVEEPPAPLLGFGAAAELLSSAVSEADEREAAERMRRYDRNKDGFVTKDELSSRFAGNPMDFDRNRDGKLSVGELAVRYARRREGQEEARQKRDAERRSEKQAKLDDGKRQEDIDLFNGRKSYRARIVRRVPEGLPGFFGDKDANADGQVTMAEFTDEWSDALVAEFMDSDFDRDGVITAAEALRAVEEGGASAQRSSGSAKPVEQAVSPAAGGKASSRNIKYAERIIKRNDQNGDGALTASEWKKMLMSPAKADFDRNGKITIDEYAMWMESRSKKK